MNKLLLSSAIVTLALTGCASSDKYHANEVVDANRSNGTVDVGFYHNGAPLTDSGEKADWTDAMETARTVCKKWGYSEVEPMNKRIYSQGRVNGYGFLTNGRVWVRFLCTGEATFNVQNKAK